MLAVPQAPEMALVVAFDHHLRHDGGGFPHLEEERPPYPAAALVAVAEAFDVLYTVRWERGVISRGEVGETLKSGAGSAFDPVFARVMYAIWDEAR